MISVTKYVPYSNRHSDASMLHLRVEAMRQRPAANGSRGLTKNIAGDIYSPYDDTGKGHREAHPSLICTCAHTQRFMSAVNTHETLTDESVSKERETV